MATAPSYVSMHCCSHCNRSELLFWRGAAKPAGIKKRSFERLRALRHVFHSIMFPLARAALDSIQARLLTGLTLDFTSLVVSLGSPHRGVSIHSMLATRHVSAAKGYTASKPPEELKQNTISISQGGAQYYTNVVFPPVTLIMCFGSGDDRHQP